MTTLCTSLALRCMLPNKGICSISPVFALSAIYVAKPRHLCQFSRPCSFCDLFCQTKVGDCDISSLRSVYDPGCQT